MPGTARRASDSSAASASSSSAVSSEPAAMSGESRQDERGLAERAVLRDFRETDARVGHQRLPCPLGPCSRGAARSTTPCWRRRASGPRSGDRSAMAEPPSCLPASALPWCGSSRRGSRGRARRSRSPSRSNQPSQRATVAVRPDQCIGKAYAMTSRATRSMSPDACAYSTAFSGSSCSAHQAAARADASAAAPGSRTSSSSRSKSRNRR